MPLRLFHYNASPYYKLGLLVVSTVFLLHKGSKSPAINGTFDIPDANGMTYFSFRYNVVRSAKSAPPICALWQLDVDELLAGGIAMLPLAPVANVRPRDVPRVIRAMRARIENEAGGEVEAAELWTATDVLASVRTRSHTCERVDGFAVQ